MRSSGLEVAAMESANSYLSFVGDWKARTPFAVAEAFADAAENDPDAWYHAYTWYLCARALGDVSAEGAVEGLETAELVCDEDRYLANLQLAIWFHRGIILDPSPSRALACLHGAALPFLELPPLETIRDAPGPGVARETAWAQALAAFGFPAPGEPDRDREVGLVGRLLDKMLERTGWPASLDFRLPLGPSMPHRPFWLHTRHAL